MGDRHHSTLQEVLKFAIKNSDCNSNAESVKEYKEIDEDRKQFLENALNYMAVDIVKELEEAIRCLESDDSSVENKVNALNVVRDYADHIDFANGFINVGGSKVVIKYLQNNNPELKKCAAYVVAELCQNNPFCQEHFLQLGVLQILISNLKDEKDVASSSMHAISALVRNFEQGSVKFIDIGGLERITECLQSTHTNVFMKSCFLLRALSTEYTCVRDKFVQLGALRILETCVDPVNGFDSKIEIVLSALCALTESDEGKAELRKTNISDVLRTIIIENDGKTECEEIISDSNTLLERLQQKIQ